MCGLHFALGFRLEYFAPLAGGTATDASGALELPDGHIGMPRSAHLTLDGSRAYPLGVRTTGGRSASGAALGSQSENRRRLLALWAQRAD